jgi:ParB family chromosome partitioning protein
LEALLGQPTNDESGQVPEAVSYESSHDAPPADTGGLIWINIYEVDRNPFQPRSVFDETEIQSLADSITAHGMLQPVVVRKSHDRFQLISGERRWRAATVAGWEKVPAQVLEVDDRQMSELALVENIQRKDLSPLEKAVSFQRYLEQYQCTQEELASRVKVDRSTIANLIRLLELPEQVQNSLRAGEITQGHARALLPLGDEHQQITFAKRVQHDGLSVRATEELVQTTIREQDAEQLSVVGMDDGAAPKPRTRSEHLVSLEQEFRHSLGAKVDLREGKRGRGRITIHFTSEDEFNRLRSYLTGGTKPESQVG